MNELIDIITRYKATIEEYDEGDRLKLFIGVLTHFNDNELVNY